jgi:Ca2+-binding EF-hand superfamily protein
MGGLANDAAIAIKNMKIADRNKDGLISHDEAQKGPVPFIRAHFDAIDREHRGAVSVDDVKAYVASLQRKPPAASSTGSP